MHLLGSISPDAMVLAFLRAEFHSARFGALYRSYFVERNLDPDTLLRRADPGDAAQNAERTAALECVRGYASRTHLFEGFPADAEWECVELEAGDTRHLRYAKHPEWIALSGGTRRVEDGARRVLAAPDEAPPHVPVLAGLVRAGASFPALIAARGANDALVLIEGHTRATAYAMTGRDAGVRVFVAASPQMANWVYI